MANEFEVEFELNDAEKIDAEYDITSEDKIDCLFSIDGVVFDYPVLANKPQINGETLEGNKTSEDLHLASKQDIVDIDNEIELLNSDLKDLDEKVDGININLTQQIDELEQDVNDKYNELIRDIDDLTDVVEEDYNTLDSKINTTSTTINQRITDVADELNQTIEENVVALQQEDTALQNQINAHSQTLTGLDSRVTNNSNSISQEIIDRQNADSDLQEQIDAKQPTGDYATRTELSEGLATKQNTLISGTNIKTLNNESLLGGGNIDITSAQWGNISGTLSNQTDLQNALDGKQPIGDYATNTALINGLATKQDTISDLGDIRNNIAQNTTNISYLDEKVRDIELFKFPNAIIIGEPTILNGQVSGFSTVSYLQFPFILDLHNQAFQIDFCFTTATNVQTQQNILDSNFGLALAIQNGKGIMAISSNGTNWDIGSAIGSINIQSNTTYYARLIWNRLQYKTQLSTDGVNYVDDMVIVDTRSPYPRTMFIGGCDSIETGHTPHPFLGTINMNKATLSVMGQVIWQGMDDAGLATRADLSLSNLDELGQAKFNAKQDVIEDLEEIRTNASSAKSTVDTHVANGTIHVTASDKIAWSNKANDNEVVHKAGAENVSGVKTFTGGTGGNNVAIKAPNGISIGSTIQTAYSQYATIRLVNDKVNTGSYYIDGNGSVLFRHKTGTKTAEGSANDVMFTMNPETGIKGGWSGTAGVGITDADLHDVLIDTIEYSKLNTTAKDVLGAINELNAKPSAPSIDNKTINQNDNNELQTIAVIDNNNNAIKTWTGTQAEYEAITVKDSNTLYNVTDTNDVSYPLLELIYPVGSLYLTTASSCPLSLLFGTWVLVAQDRVLQGAGTRGAVGTTIDESLPNITGVVGASYNNITRGAFYQSGENGGGLGAGSYNFKGATFDASRSSSTYQDDAPVQQNAYLINVYRRIS